MVDRTAAAIFRRQGGAFINHNGSGKTEPMCSQESHDNIITGSVKSLDHFFPPGIFMCTYKC